MLSPTFQLTLLHHRVAGEIGVEMPICEQIYRIIYEGADPRNAVSVLMQRALKAEFAPGG